MIKILDIKIKKYMELVTISLQGSNMNSKGKAVPLQAWTGPQGSRRSVLPDF
jgi:hypothetical protein